ncbi:MAG: hypothetical protein AAF270_10735 [Pseudomonadota bacterium]
MTQSFGNDRSRLSVAQEAARIMADHGISDFHAAKRKAALRLGLDRQGTLPSNTEVEAALIEHHRLYSEQDHIESLRRRRESALALMLELEVYEPRLVGPVLAGTASEDAPVNMHVFSDSAEDVAWYLDGQGIDYRLFERRLQIQRGRSQSYPGYRFDWQGLGFEITVFAYDGLRQAPLSPVDGKPMPRAAIKKVRKLLATTDAAEV